MYSVHLHAYRVGSARDRDGVMTRRWARRSHYRPTLLLGVAGAMACGALQSGIGVQGTRLGRKVGHEPIREDHRGIESGSKGVEVEK